MAYTKRIGWEPLRSFDSATLTGSYQALGIPFSHPAYKLKLLNNSGVSLTISNDGSTAIDILLPNSNFLYDATFNIQSDSAFYPAGTQFYIKGTAGTGLIYLSVQYIITA